MKKRPKLWCVYRARWLMAHNALHDLQYGKDNKKAAKEWKKYLKLLKTAEKLACTPA